MRDKTAALSRIVCVEEHIADLDLMSRLPKTAVVERGYFSRDKSFRQASMLDKMSDTEERLKRAEHALGLALAPLGSGL
jgi:hypothetical protein